MVRFLLYLMFTKRGIDQSIWKKEVNQFASEAGIPSAADGEVDKLIDGEAKNFGL